MAACLASSVLSENSASPALPKVPEKLIWPSWPRSISTSLTSMVEVAASQARFGAERDIEGGDAAGLKLGDRHILHVVGDGDDEVGQLERDVGRDAVDVVAERRVERAQGAAALAGHFGVGHIDVEVGEREAVHHRDELAPVGGKVGFVQGGGSTRGPRWRPRSPSSSR